MNWEPQDKYGYTLLHAQVDQRLYAIQKKEGLGQVRLFIRLGDDEPLRTIFMGASLKECFDYADSYEVKFNDE